MTTPSSTISLYSGVPLDNTYRNVINGGLSLGNAYNRLQWTSQTWIRIVGQYNNKVRVDCSPKVWGDNSFRSDYLFNYNYIAIENASYKTIYGFITDILYINDNVAEITFEIDVFHTYYNDYSFCKCWVERATPDVGWSASGYSLPDYFEDSEYDTVATDDWTPLGDDLALVCFCAPPKGRTYGTDDFPLPSTGVMSGFLTGAYVFGVTGYNATATDLSHFRSTLNQCYKEYHLDCINAVLMPTALFNTPAGVFTANSGGNINNVNSWFTISVNSNTMNGISIKNNKLFTYPYTFLEVTNNLGDAKRYAWEGWQGLGAFFHVRAVSVPTPTITLIPRNYFGKDYDFENSITIDNFPSMPVQADTIASWVAQNAATSAIKGIGTTASGAITGAMVGNAPGAIIGGALGATGAFTDYVANYQKAYNTPSRMTSMSGSGSPIMLPQIEKMGFTFRAKCIRSETIHTIDDYFTRYGITENRLEYPPINRAVRGHYHYIKTKECSIRCDSGEGMPVWAEKKICEIHDSGVTYWDSLLNVGSY